MKPSGFLAGLAVGLLGLAAFVVTSRSADPAPALDHLRETAWLQRELKLDNAQVEQLTGLEKQYAAALSDCCENRCGARMRMGAAVFAKGQNPDQLQALLEEMGKAQLASDRATVEHLQAVHAALKPDQQKQYEELVTACVCAACPSCSNRSP